MRGPISSRPSRRRAKRCSDPFPPVRVAAEAVVLAPEAVPVVPKIALLPLICDKNAVSLPMICNKSKGLLPMICDKNSSLLPLICNKVF